MGTKTQRKPAQIIEDDLKAAGIPAKVYAKPPNGKENSYFAQPQGKNILRFWPGKASVKVYGGDRAAVILIDEPARDILMSRNVNISNHANKSMEQLKKMAREQTRWCWYGRIPKTARLADTVVTIKDPPPAQDPGGCKRACCQPQPPLYRPATVRRRYRVPAKMTALFVKMTQGQMSIIELPNPVTSVDAAIDQLRPHSKPGSIHVDNLAFTPVDERTKAQIAKHLADSSRSTSGMRKLTSWNDPVAYGVRIGRTAYATGAVTSSGSSVMLDGWYEMSKRKIKLWNPSDQTKYIYQ